MVQIAYFLSLTDMSTDQFHRAKKKETMAERRFTLFRDPTQGRIKQRIIRRMMEIAHHFTELTGEEQSKFDDILLRTGSKLVAVWTHLDRYQRVEDELVTIAENKGPIDEQEVPDIEYSQELFLEVDEFLVQLKSTLDHLVKIPIPIFGEKRWRLTTFHKKGQEVGDALLNNIPRSHRLRAESIKQELERHRPWLTGVIEMRDASNHFLRGGLNVDRLKVFRHVVDGETRLHVPMWDEALTVRRVMETSWISLLQFTEDFIALFLSFRIVPELGMIHEIVDHESNESPWQVATSEEVDRKRREPDHRIIVPRIALFAALPKPKKETNPSRILTVTRDAIVKGKPPKGGH